MTRDIRAILELKKCSELYNLVILIGLGVFSSVIGIISGNISAEDIVVVAICSSVGGYFILSAFFKVFLMADEVPRGLAFGMTRRKLFAYSRLIELSEVIVLTVIAAVALREFLELNLAFKISAVCFASINLVEGLAGNSIIRYGKKAYWIYYVVVMVLSFGGPKATTRVSGGAEFCAKVVDVFSNPAYKQGPIWLGLLGFVVLSVLINWITYRKIAI